MGNLFKRFIKDLAVIACFFLSIGVLAPCIVITGNWILGLNTHESEFLHERINFNRWMTNLRIEELQDRIEAIEAEIAHLREPYPGELIFESEPLIHLTADEYYLYYSLPPVIEGFGPSSDSYIPLE